MPFSPRYFTALLARSPAILSGFLRLLGIGVADDDGAAARLILQAQGNVIEDAFANVVDARAERPAERAIADLAGLRRRRHGLYLDHRRAIRGPAAAVVDAHRHRVIARREARRVEVHCRATAYDPAGIGAPGVGERVAVGIAGIRCDMNPLTRKDRWAVGRAGDRWRMIRLGYDAASETLELAVPPRPSSTFAVMVHEPTGTPAESQRTWGPVPSTCPQVEDQV